MMSPQQAIRQVRKQQESSEFQTSKHTFNHAIPLTDEGMVFHASVPQHVRFTGLSCGFDGCLYQNKRQHFHTTEFYFAAWRLYSDPLNQAVLMSQKTTRTKQ